MNYRIGSVPFLNAKPLIEGLQGVSCFPPSELVVKFRAGDFDAALLPVIEVIERPENRVVNGICIAAQRIALSVFIAYQKPIYDVRRISVDAQSVTSVSLAKVIMERDYGMEIEWVEEHEEADAQLLIGDKALAFRDANPKTRILDLGRAWNDRRKLPFVFAVWAIHPSVSDPAAISSLLHHAQKQGLKKRRTYAQNEQEWKYLTENMHYDLGKNEKEGIFQFQRELISVGLLPQMTELIWV